MNFLPINENSVTKGDAYCDLQSANDIQASKPTVNASPIYNFQCQLKSYNRLSLFANNSSSSVLISYLCSHAVKCQNTLHQVKRQYNQT